MTISSSCTNSPQSYGWTGCTGLGPTCTATAIAAGKKTYQLVASNSAGLGPPAYLDVTWVQAGPPTCTVTPSNANPIINANITLTANCTGATGGFSWTNCTSSTSTCQTTSSATGTVTYSVTASNSQGTSVPASTPVLWKAPPPPPTAAPTCSIAPDIANPFVGQNVTLTATCDMQTSSYKWTGCTPATDPSKCSASASAAGGATYTVVGHNVIGDGQAASLSLTWQASTAPADFCPAAQAAGAKIARATGPSWGFAGYTYPSDYGGSFTSNTIVVVPVTVPGVPSSYDRSPAFGAHALEYQGPATMRWVSLSKSRCDFRAEDPTGVSGPISFDGDKNGYSASQGVGGRVGANEVMKPGETWYINVWNHSAKYPACPTKGANCTFALGYFWPS